MKTTTIKASLIANPRGGYFLKYEGLGGLSHTFESRDKAIEFAENRGYTITNK